MSITFKQAEAFYWIATLGGVVDAAGRLSLAQSTVSKRLLELESIVGTTLFDRGNREMCLTRSGSNLLPLAVEMLQLEARFRKMASGPLAFSGPFRFGVTELVALTWLPKIIYAMKEAYPELVPEPEVDASVNLFKKLADRRLDLAIGLDPPADARFQPVPLDSATLRWMCAPGVGPKGNVVPLAEIAKYPILAQTEDSGLQKLVMDRLATSGVKFNRIVKCNSISVLSALATAGLGITFLNERYFQPEIKSGRLRVIKSDRPLPPIKYFAVRRTDALDPLAEQIAQMARRCCDFSLRQNSHVLESV